MDYKYITLLYRMRRIYQSDTLFSFGVKTFFIFNIKVDKYIKYDRFICGSNGVSS